MAGGLSSGFANFRAKVPAKQSPRAQQSPRAFEQFKLRDDGFLGELDTYVPSKDRPQLQGLTRQISESSFAAGNDEDTSECDSFVFRLLARLPALHSFGFAWLVVFTFPRHCPIFGAWVSLSLFAYGMGKFLLTGLWAFYGFAVLVQQERSMRISQFGETGRSGRARGSEDRRYELEEAALNPQEVVHCVLIPCYKEASSTIEATVNTLAEQTVAGQIVVVLAMEDRDPQAEETAQLIRDRFAESPLAGVYYSLHRLDVGETAGKSSNENWGFRGAKHRLCDDRGCPLESLVFTTCDADTFFHPKHFEYLTHEFLMSGGEARHSTIWQAAICFLPNSDDLPAICSVRYMLLTIGMLGQLANRASPTGPFPLSVYSLSGKLAYDVGYWDPSVVPEDWHMFFRTNLERPNGGPDGVRCSPLFVPVGCLGVELPGYCETIQACYQQAVRWQWGAIDFPYILMKLYNSSCSCARKFMLVLGFWEHHLLYPIMWVALVTMPSMYHDKCLDIRWPYPIIEDGPCVGHRFHVGSVSSKLWLFFFVSNWSVLLVLDLAYRRLTEGRTNFERVPKGFPTLKRSLSFLVFPLADVFLFLIPTLHAHARMFMSTKFEYIVSPKWTLEDSDSSSDDGSEQVSIV